MEGTGVEGRGGEGRGGQGRVPDCLGGLSRVGISSRSTRPWNGQPPSNSTNWEFVMVHRNMYNYKNTIIMRQIIYTADIYYGCNSCGMCPSDL